MTCPTRRRPRPKRARLDKTLPGEEESPVLSSDSFPALPTVHYTYVPSPLSLVAHATRDTDITPVDKASPPVTQEECNPVSFSPAEVQYSTNYHREETGENGQEEDLENPVVDAMSLSSDPLQDSSISMVESSSIGESGSIVESTDTFTDESFRLFDSISSSNEFVVHLCMSRFNAPLELRKTALSYLHRPRSLISAGLAVGGSLSALKIPVKLQHLVKAYLCSPITDESIHGAFYSWRYERDYAKLRYGHICSWDTSNVTNMD